MQVITVLHHEQPAVTMRLLVRAGGANDPDKKRGVSYLVSTLLDQGTTSTRFMVFDHFGNEIARHQLEHQQILPQPGWVEHDPLEIAARTDETIARAQLMQEPWFIMASFNAAHLPFEAPDSLEPNDAAFPQSPDGNYLDSHSLASRCRSHEFFPMNTFKRDSGDYVIAFSTAEGVRRVGPGPFTVEGLANDAMSDLFVAVAAVIAATSYVLPSDMRLWLGHAYLIAGYRLPALLVAAGTRPTDDVCRPGAAASHDDRAADPATAFESWLVRTDRRWFPFRFTRPAWATHALELAYLFCYLLVPSAFVFIWLTASIPDADRFWTAVLLAGFACYGLLPWLVSPPPRVRHVELAEAAGGLRRLNLQILGRASHGFNTFPSGHVAVSVAAALAVLALSTSAGIAALVRGRFRGKGAIYAFLLSPMIAAAANGVKSPTASSAPPPNSAKPANAACSLPGRNSGMRMRSERLRRAHDTYTGAS